MPERRVSFAPGPAMLPDQVVTAFRDAVTTYGGSGLGILELGHRSTEFAALLDDTEHRLRTLVEVPDDYEVLVLHGGARMQFAMLPANLLLSAATADYIDSGHFATAAASEAATYGKVRLVASSAADDYRRLPHPADHEYTPGSAYTHYTSNNTEVGTQFGSLPSPPGDAWLACDASSDLLTRPFDVRAHGVIYATAHKNLGTAGLAVVIIRRSLLSAVRSLPSFFRYAVHAEARSRYNTPPIASVLTLNLMLRWITDAGGVAEMARRSQAKASALYDAIDGSDFYRGLVEPTSRSLVNVTFAAPSVDLEQDFLAEAARCGLDGLWGYRKVGHLRASLFNAVSMAHCQRLIDFMADFASRHRSRVAAASHAVSARSGP